MHCPRCAGLMRRERIYWRRSQTWLRCLSCGNRTDQTILYHRAPVRRPSTAPGVWEKIQDLVAKNEVSPC